MIVSRTVWKHTVEIGIFEFQNDNFIRVDTKEITIFTTSGKTEKVIKDAIKQANALPFQTAKAIRVMSDEEVYGIELSEFLKVANPVKRPKSQCKGE